MRPFMNPEVQWIQEADRKRFQRDYGEPIAPDPGDPQDPDEPDVPTPGDGNMNGFVTIGNVSLTIDNGNGSFIFPEEDWP